MMHEDLQEPSEHRRMKHLRRQVGVALGLIGFFWMHSASPPEGMTVAAWHVAGVALLMAFWWVGDVLPRAVTALVPLVAFPLLGVATMRETAAPYAHPLLFLMLGGFVMGHAMETVGIHQRLTSWLLSSDWVRASPRRVLGALMLATATLSGLVSNTATTLMMLPLALSLAGLGDDKTKPAFVLGLAYAASIGGLTTLVGTPPNAVLAGLVPELVGQSVGFGQWMLVGVPMAVVLLPIAWWVVGSSVFELPQAYAVPVTAPPRLPWRPGERSVIAIAGLAMLAWLTRSDKVLGALTVPGWSRAIPGVGLELDASVALLAAGILFLLPGREPSRPHLLTWAEAEASIPWSVMLLLGGGFSLAGAIGSSGLTAWLAGGTSALDGLPLPVSMLAIAVVMTFVTELTSNTATATIVLPVLAASALSLGLDPLMWMVPATISASCAFMMPVATAPNAIASEAGGVEAVDMARAGFRLNLLGALAVSVVSALWVPIVFG